MNHKHITNTFIYTYTYQCTSTYIYRYNHVYSHVHVRAYVHTHMYIHTYTYIMKLAAMITITCYTVLAQPQMVFRTVCVYAISIMDSASPWHMVFIHLLKVPDFSVVEIIVIFHRSDHIDQCGE